MDSRYMDIHSIYIIMIKMIMFTMMIHMRRRSHFRLIAAHFPQIL